MQTVEGPRRSPSGIAEGDQGSARRCRTSQEGQDTAGPASAEQDFAGEEPEAVGEDLAGGEPSAEDSQTD